MSIQIEKYQQNRVIDSTLYSTSTI